MDDDDDGTGEDLQLILTFGAKALFEECDQSSKDINYVDNDIEKFIKKIEVEGDQQAATKEAGLSFTFAKAWAADKDTMEEIQEDVLGMEQGDSWARALERIAAEKGDSDDVCLLMSGGRARHEQEKEKHRPSKSDAYSDSDTFAGTPGVQATDSSASSMDMDVVEELSTISHKARMKADTKAKCREQASAREDEDTLLCGLCNIRYEKGVCYMAEDSTNLVEYREMLMNHDSDKPWQVKKRRLLKGVMAKQKKKRAHDALGVQKPKIVLSSNPSTSSVPPRGPTLRSSSTTPPVTSTPRLSRPIGESEKVGRQMTLEFSIIDKDRGWKIGTTKAVTCACGGVIFLQEA
ncbi:hypothetical protein EDB19DRAFT_1943698 [Suillus lakei]|nr:hypothetical protein EDB19DRAFT_1943698 [Suillus lakei]